MWTLVMNFSFANSIVTLMISISKSPFLDIDQPDGIESAYNCFVFYVVYHLISFAVKSVSKKAMQLMRNKGE